MRALALHFHRDKPLDACQIYRANMPFYFLGQQRGWDAAVENFEAIKNEYRRRGPEVFIDLVRAYDIFVYPRTTALTDDTLTGLSALTDWIRKAGRRVVYVVDDDFTNKHRDLTHMGVSRSMQIASWCDASTVTTPYLASLMEAETRRPSYVLPNCIDPAIWRRPEKRTDEGQVITIGLSGSPTHVGDWKLMEEVLGRIMRQTYDVPVQLMVVGFHPDYLRDLPNTHFLPPVPYNEYAEMVRFCDIVLAPVDPEDGFNWSKSPIKVIEGMGASRVVNGKVVGAVTVATDMNVYQLAIQNRKNGILCRHEPEAWYNALDELLRNPALRQTLQSAGHTWAWKRHDITKEWTQWARAYQRIAAKPQNTLTLP